MPHALLPLVLCTLALACSCKGCSDAGAAEGPAREQQSEQAQMRARVAARRLDRHLIYPKAADGAIECGKDADCFLIQGERCAKATVTHKDKLSAYGLVETIEARYRIVGSDQGKCKLLRDTTKVTATIDPHWRDALMQKGITDEQLEQTRATALETLREGNPGRFACSLDADQMLEAGLNLAESHYDPTFWRLACSVAEAPEPKP
jgi:hypothetical protein